MRFLDWYKTLRTVKSPAPGEFGDTTDARAQDNMALHRNDSWTHKICGSYRIFPQFLYSLLSVAWVVFKALVHPLATYLFHSFSPQSQSSCSEQQRIQRFRRKIADFSLRSLRFWCWCPCILWLGLPTRLTAIILLQLPELASCSRLLFFKLLRSLSHFLGYKNKSKKHYFQLFDSDTALRQIP